jgi:glutathione S-transferase
LACAFGKVPLEDIRVGGEEFVEMRDSGKLPYGQLPVLQVDNGTIIGQSAAILRYIGKYAGLYPTDDHLQAAIIDSIIDEEIDLFTSLSVTRYKGVLEQHFQIFYALRFIYCYFVRRSYGICLFG